MRVWNYLQSIPYGEVRSYGEVAGASAQPRQYGQWRALCAQYVCAGDPVPSGDPRDGRVGRVSVGRRADKQSLLDMERSRRTA